MMLCISVAALCKPQGTEGRADRTPPRKESLSGVECSDELMRGGWFFLCARLFSLFPHMFVFTSSVKNTEFPASLIIARLFPFQGLKSVISLVSFHPASTHTTFSSCLLSVSAWVGGVGGNVVSMDQGVLTCQLFIILPGQKTDFMHCPFSTGISCRSPLLRPTCLDEPGSFPYSLEVPCSL